MMKFALITIVAIVAYADAQWSCYDCYYSPTGFIIGKGDSNIKIPYTNRACALPLRYDGRNYGGRKFCKSNVCFIRKDENGLVYRGCVDDLKLPAGIDYNNKCQYLDHEKRGQHLHYFCKGDLCNHGQLGETTELCGSDEQHSGTDAAGLCNGNCDKNPKGIFPHSSDIHYYIHCDAGTRWYRHCTCCEPRVLKCPPETSYDDKDKACVAGNHLTE